MFNHILLPTDGSTGSLRAAAIVADLAKQNPSATVTVVCAIATTDPSKSDLNEDIIEQQNAAIRHHAESALEATCKIFTQSNVPCTCMVITGDPVSASIVELTRKQHFDVIAMASHGLTLKHNDRHYIGSVTDHVVRQVDIPLLVIPVRSEV